MKGPPFAFFELFIQTKLAVSRKFLINCPPKVIFSWLPFTPSSSHPRCLFMSPIMRQKSPLSSIILISFNTLPHLSLISDLEDLLSCSPYILIIAKGAIKFECLVIRNSSFSLPSRTLTKLSLCSFLHP